MAHKLLIVDDEEATIFGLRVLLESDQVEVLSAGDLPGAKEILSNNQVEVMVSDIRLTGIGATEGLDLLEFIRDNRLGTRSILITAYGDPDTMQRAFDLGAGYYFEKPVEISVLSKAISDLGIPVAVGR